MTHDLFSPLTLGRLTLPNRVVMAPMTRSRATNNLANELMARYYAARASAGLLITEGTAPDGNGLGYARIPGVFSDAQVAGWRQVTDAVHAAGGRIVVQLMHTGRIGHPHNLPAGARLLGPSAIAAPGQMYTDVAGMQPHPVPEAMTEADIATAIEGFAHASRQAVAAGFDGVELHGANGYLIEQFLNGAANQRTDRWGGDVAGRTRFAIEVARAAAAAIGADRVGFRVSPYGRNGGLAPDPDTDELYVHLAGALGGLGLLYLHVVDHAAMGAPALPPTIKPAIRRAFPGTLILCGGYDRARAEHDLSEGHADLIAFGRPFLANPTLVDKLRTGAPLAEADMSKNFTPGPDGYVV
ncbi:MAG: alkene reductase [Kofleriaceae bacterium]|nr:alkene reductase [Kofleriaceae bacterium]MBP9206858.1 alkene reductase [Kofleriaceae bacterium]